MINTITHETPLSCTVAYAHIKQRYIYLHTQVAGLQLWLDSSLITQQHMLYWFEPRSER